MTNLFETTSRCNYVLVQSVPHLQQLLSTMPTSGKIAADTETSGLDLYKSDYTAGISLSWAPRQGIYIPVRHARTNNLPVADVRELLQPILCTPTYQKQWWNVKFDAHALAQLGIFIHFPTSHDGPVKLGLIDENIENKKLKPFSIKYIEPDAARYEREVLRLCDVMGLGHNYSMLSGAEICDYACADTDYTLRSADLLDPTIERDPYLRNLYVIEQQMAEVLWWMEHRGVHIDSTVLDELDTDLTKRITEVKHSAYQAAGCVFDLNSTKETSKILYEWLKLPVLSRTKTGQGSTEKLILKRLSALHALPAQLIEYNRLTKLHSTYVTGIKNRLSSSNTLHTTYNQSVARTHRLSSSGPNLQNIPAKDKIIRKSFVVPPDDPDAVLIPIDQSQVELRVTAEWSQEPEWVRAFKEGRDLHAVMCSRIFSVPLEEFSKDPVPDYAKEKRSLTKPCNFGELYGVTPEGLVDYLETWGLQIDQETAEGLHRDWWAAVPHIKALFNRVVASCRERGYIQDMYGAYRRLPDITSRNKVDREAAERQAFNFIIQGSCAWMLKIAMIKMHRLLQGALTTLRMTVHDEVILYGNRKELHLVDGLKACMEDYPNISIPIEANVSFSTTSWAAKKEIKA